MKSSPLIGNAITAVAVMLLTSGIWIAVYFAAIKPASKGDTYNIVNNYSNGTNSSISSDWTQTCVPPPPVECERTCEFVICETIPAGVTFNSSYPVFNKTTDCWMRLMNEAQKEIVIGSYYWSLLVQNTGDNYTVDTTNTSGDGQLIYDTLLKTAQRGVDVKIAQTYKDGGYPETTDLATKSNGRIKVRSLDFTQWYPGGIFHTKSWAVDGKHLYVGSANFDWRALTQVRELGLAVFNCPCLANDLGRLLEIYWEMGAPGAKIPKSWPASLSTPAYHERPTSVPQEKGDQAVYFSASPPGFQSCGREDDLDAMVKLIDEAQVSLDMAVMNYAPCSLYLKPLNKWYGRLDEAIRRAAFDRQVKIRFLFSRWRYTAAKYYSYLHSLADISSQLQCVYKHGKCSKKGSIDIRIIQVPDMQYGGIPYSRVYHNKYFVTEKAAYIGTSNWTPDYWWYTAGIGMVVRADDISQKSYLVDQFAQIFERDWNSGMTIPLSYFDNNGKWTNKTTTL
ncbi:phospholipase D domain protein [Ancylostoma caninum]|uniref:Phospholipase D domain protein n=1 Tax=Ancylostoma caninum TaxID=29170 RepID=A0A368H222_ANCCA|nr:phospholipase D domain protein [Ancylostoma caninum]